MDKKVIYIWANDTTKNNGEGILALNFICLLKTKFKNYKLKYLNNIKKKNNFIYNYLFPIFGLIKIWYYNLNGKVTCYLNYLPIWNIILLFLLPKKTILGPITGNDLKKNYIYIFLKKIGIFILKIKSKKILFSHDQFKHYFKKKNTIYYNFLLYNLKLKKPSKKKYDFVFYYKNNYNKGNEFLFKVLKKLSHKFKIIIIGDKIPSIYLSKNILNYINLNRSKAIELISKAKYAIGSKENYISYFILDCLSCKLTVFYNSHLKISKDIKTNLFVPIIFNNVKKSVDIIEDYIKKKIKKKIFNYKVKNFLEYLS